MELKKPLPAVPTLLSLIDELETITAWQELGLRLGIPEHTLQEIKVDSHEKVLECRSGMLSCWIKSTANPSWEDVIAALGRMKEWKVAAKIKYKFEAITRCEGKENYIVLLRSIMVQLCRWTFTSIGKTCGKKNYIQQLYLCVVKLISFFHSY